MSTDTASFDLDSFLPYLLNVLASRVSLGLAAVYEERFGITVPEWRILAHLASHEEVSVREVRIRANMDKSKVSRAAATLEKAGLITKRVNLGDRRLVKLSMTRKGHRLFEQIVPLALDYERTLLSSLSAEQSEALRTVIVQLQSAMPPGGEHQEDDD
jgi:DNA-binding MarR family transcriptional regulator